MYRSSPKKINILTLEKTFVKAKHFCNHDLLKFKKQPKMLPRQYISKTSTLYVTIFLRVFNALFYCIIIPGKGCAVYTKTNVSRFFPEDILGIRNQSCQQKTTLSHFVFLRTVSLKIKNKILLLFNSCFIHQCHFLPCHSLYKKTMISFLFFFSKYAVLITTSSPVCGEASNMQ